jgi:hypothetical protein
MLQSDILVSNLSPISGQHTGHRDAIERRADIWGLYEIVTIEAIDLLMHFCTLDTTVF